MMNKKNSSGAGMFMLEMIAAVFFFILCAAICIRVFVKADSMSRLAKDTNNGVLAAESVAEVWKVKGPEGLSGRFHAQAGDGQVLLCWDREWNAVADAADAAYQGELSWSGEAGLETARIVIRRADGKGTGTELFDMTAARYVPDRG